MSEANEVVEIVRWLKHASDVHHYNSELAAKSNDWRKATDERAEGYRLNYLADQIERGDYRRARMAGAPMQSVP